MVIISLLSIYMSFLLCLDPIMNQSPRSTNTSPKSQHYQRQINESTSIDNPTQECVVTDSNSMELQNNRRRQSLVLNLVTHEQAKWRKQVWNCS